MASVRLVMEDGIGNAVVHFTPDLKVSYREQYVSCTDVGPKILSSYGKASGSARKISDGVYLVEVVGPWKDVKKVVERLEIALGAKYLEPHVFGFPKHLKTRRERLVYVLGCLKQVWYFVWSNKHEEAL